MTPVDRRRNDQERHSTIGFIIGYAVLFYLMGMMIWPYLSPMIFGIILAGTFYPSIGVLKRLGIGKRISVLLVMASIVCLFFVPSIYLVVEITDEALQLFQYLKENVTEETLEEIFFGEGYLPQLLEQVFSMLNVKYNVSSIQNLILDSAKTTSSYLLETVNSWVANLLSFLLQFVIMMVVIYGILSEGTRVRDFVLGISPLPSDEEELVMEKFNQMNFVTLVGNGIGGIIQGTLAGMALWMAGIDSIFLWTTSMVVLAFIPMVGMSVIYVPAGIYLWFSGKITESIAVLTFCTLVAFWVEQWFKPKFVGKRVAIHSVLVFLAILGGMTVFGFLGIFYGPLIMSIFLTFVDLYKKRYGHEIPELADI